MSDLNVGSQAYEHGQNSQCSTFYICTMEMMTGVIPHVVMEKKGVNTYVALRTVLGTQQELSKYELFASAWVPWEKDLGAVSLRGGGDR